jgi:hypothetical protein
VRTVHSLLRGALARVSSLGVAHLGSLELVVELHLNIDLLLAVYSIKKAPTCF